METSRVLYLGLFVVLLVVDSSIANSQENLKLNNGVDSQLKEKNNLKDTKSNHVNNEKKSEGDHDSKPKEGVDNGVNKNNLENKVENQSGSKEKSKEKDNVEEGKGGLSEEVRVKDRDGSKEKNSDGGSKAKEVPEEKGKKGGTKDPVTQQKESSRDEECGSSNTCADQKNKLVACLRVPGDDSPDLLLFIQNKGKGPLSVAISAPDFVHVEETKFELQEKKDKKMKVSITEGGSGSFIVLNAGNGDCKLDIKDFLKSTPANFLSQSSTIVILAFAALLILATGWMCISFRKKQHSSNASKYQRLDMELPVTNGGKTLSETNDGWDNNWGDDWDDEEAPKTPSMPVTPSLSSKGLASRRLSKEGWKD